jgi:uncharacterized protein (TIGR03118 family)
MLEKLGPRHTRKPEKARERKLSMTAQRIPRFVAASSGILALLLSPSLLHADFYSQTNLVSDVPGLAKLTDSNLVDPWGLAFNATSPFWVSDNGSNRATLYTGTPTINAMVVTVLGGPTGQVNNGNTSLFILSDSSAANFIFDTQAGTLLAWNGGLGSTANIVYTNPSSAASYTGLAIGTSGGNTFLYAANAAGSIDVFNSSFAPATLSGNFTDPNLPAGYVPYNIQLIGTQLYVTYVKYDSMGNEIPSGIVDVFNTNGTFASRFSSSSALDAPWGITLAPTSFGSFGGDILVGNFLNGEINAFDPVSGTFIGTIDGSNGQPIANPGLWALDFRTGGTGNSTNALYFTAGINDEEDGLFGEITPVPEPAPIFLAGFGILALALVRGVRPKILSTPRS